MHNAIHATPILSRVLAHMVTARPKNQTPGLSSLWLPYGAASDVVTVRAGGGGGGAHEGKYLKLPPMVGTGEALDFGGGGAEEDVLSGGLSSTVVDAGACLTEVDVLQKRDSNADEPEQDGQVGHSHPSTYTLPAKRICTGTTEKHTEGQMPVHFSKPAALHPKKTHLHSSP